MQQDFAVDAANAAAILSICTHLDGIPLALELAAVRLKSLGLDALDRGLAARLGALGTGDRSVSLRQQTLEGAIDWSYQLLSEPERLLWARLSVFAGGFELDAAQAVCAGDGLDAEDDPGARRVARREVGPQTTTGQRPPTASDSSNRFGSSAASGSGEAGDGDGPATSSPRLDLELASIAGANDARQVDAFERISVERANVWTALDFCLSDPAEAQSGAEICQDLWIYWAAQGPATDVRRVLAALLELSPGRPVGRAAQLLWIVGCLLRSQQGDQSTATRMATEALEIGRCDRATRSIVAWALQALGVAAYLEPALGRHDRATPQSHSISPETMGLRFAALSRPRPARRRATRSVASSMRESRSPRDGLRSSEEPGRDVGARHAASASWRSPRSIEGEPAEADAHARRCLELERDLGDLIGMASAVEALASIAMSRSVAASAPRPSSALARRDLAIHPDVAARSRLRADHDRADSGRSRRRSGAARFEAAHGARPADDARRGRRLRARGPDISRPRRTTEPAADGWAAVAARDGSGRARGRWSHERAGGGASVHLRADGREPSGEHLQQAGRRYPSPGRAMVAASQIAGPG